MVPGLQTVWHQLTTHVKQDRRATGDTIRSCHISLAGDNNTSNNCSNCSICQIRHMSACNTCYLPRCGIKSCNVSKNPCPTCQEFNTPTPDTRESDIPSANLHVKGLYFIECISGVGSNPRRTEMEDENTDPQTDPNIRFQVVVRGWSDRNQQTRAETLLALSNEKMVKALQLHQDILLIPRDWWSDPHNTLGPEEPGWWYTVSCEMWYQGCSSCKNRIGKDHQDTDRCPECPAKIKKRKQESEGMRRTNKRQALEIWTNTQLYRAPRRSQHGRGLGRGIGQGLGRHTTRLPMHLSRPKTGWDRRWRDHDSQPHGDAAGPYTPTDHRRSKGMDDIIPDRIPA